MNTQVDPKIADILKAVEPYGFKFFGYNEAKEALVTAPNGQVLPLKNAHALVQQQISNLNAQGQGGIENIPQMPAMPNTIANVESKIETKIEQQSNSIEKETQPNQTKVSTQPIVQNPKQEEKKPAAAKKIKIDPPFGDGFKPKNVDPTDPVQLTNFTNAHINASSSDPRKWLALEFERVLERLREEGKI